MSSYCPAAIVQLQYCPAAVVQLLSSYCRCSPSCGYPRAAQILTPSTCPNFARLHSANIIVANMLGAGVLGLPSACAGMGWVGSVVTLLALTAFSIYGGLLLGILKGGDHSIDTYPELARRAARNVGPGAAKFWGRFTSVIGSVYMLGSCTIYLVTCKISLMLVLQKTQPPGTGPAVPAQCVTTGSSNDGIADLSENIWLVAVAALLYPLVHIRSLADASIVAVVGVATIAVVNLIIIAVSISTAASGGSSAGNGTTPNASVPLSAVFGFDSDSLAAGHEYGAYEGHPGASTHAGPQSLMAFVNGMTQLAFAYGWHVLMVDIQASMAVPAEWPKSIYLSQLFMFGNYCIVGCVSLCQRPAASCSAKEGGRRGAILHCLLSPGYPGSQLHINALADT